MTDTSRADGQLQIYQRYSSMGRQTINSQQRVVYECMAREALRQLQSLILLRGPRKRKSNGES